MAKRWLRFQLGWLGLVVLLLTASASPRHRPERYSTPLLKGVPSFIQSTSYSCGVAALMSVMAYYGIETPSEADLMEMLGTTPEFGTVIEKMADYANDVGVKAEVKTGLTLEDIARHLQRRQPVLVEAQAWPDGGKPAQPYPQTWTEGHYLVVIGMDDNQVYFRDPSLPGSIGYMSMEDFDQRWHDVSAKNEKLTHTAILFDGQPQPPPTMVAIP